MCLELEGSDLLVLVIVVTVINVDAPEVNTGHEEIEILVGRSCDANGEESMNWKNWVEVGLNIEGSHVACFRNEEGARWASKTRPGQLNC